MVNVTLLCGTHDQRRAGPQKHLKWPYYHQPRFLFRPSMKTAAQIDILVLQTPPLQLFNNTPSAKSDAGNYAINELYALVVSMSERVLLINPSTRLVCLC